MLLILKGQLGAITNADLSVYEHTCLWLNAKIDFVEAPAHAMAADLLRS